MHRHRRIGNVRDTVEVQVWLLRHGIKQMDIAKEVGIDRSIVSRTIAGTANHRRVLARLLELGCPPHILDLPADLREAA